MISRREAIGGVVGVLVGSHAATATVARAAEPPALHNVTLSLRGGFGLHVQGAGPSRTLDILTPKRPMPNCSWWMDHPLKIVGVTANVELTSAGGASNGTVGGVWWVDLEGDCIITAGMPITGIRGPQAASADLEIPYTPVPYNSINGWNDAAWGIPLGNTPPDLNSRVASRLTLTAGNVTVLPPANKFALHGRWLIPRWDTVRAGARLGTHRRALTDRMTIAYSDTFEFLTIRTGNMKEIKIRPKATALDLTICREVQPSNVCYASGDKLDHVRMIYSLACDPTMDRCTVFDVPEYETISGRPVQSCDTPTPGDLCPFGFFDVP